MKMVAYYFRVIEDDGKPNGWVGFAMARNMWDLMWQIDCHVDPYSVEIKVANSFSYCEKQIKEGEYEYNLNHDDTEVCETPLFDDDGWKKPKWVTDPDFEV
jgi:hypothetical protein